MYDIPEYKPLVSKECKEERFVDCNYGDNGLSIWCDSGQDDLAKALGKEGVPRTVTIDTPISLAGDTGVSSSERGSTLTGSLKGDVGPT